MFSTFTSANFDTPLETKLVKIPKPHGKAVLTEVSGASGNSHHGSRSRYGCLTCRKKKKRCDEVKPICGLCKKQSHSCNWKIPGTERRNRTKTRRTSNSTNLDHLFTLEDSKSTLETAEELEIASLDKETLQKDQDLAQHQDIAMLVPSPGTPDLNMASLASFTDPNGLIKSPSLLMTIHDLLNPKKDGSLHQDAESDSADKEIKDFSLSSPSADSPSKIADFVLKYFKSPHILIRPSDTFTKDLDDQGIFYLDYYRNCVATTVSIAPVETNYFLNFYLPLASKEKSVLFAIIGWGGMFMNGSKDNIAYSYYIQHAIDLCKEKLNSNSLNKNDILVLMATLTILTAAEVCVGDVKQWYVFFEKIYRIIKGYGLKNLIQEFGHCNELRWLILNFLYHDVLASRSLKNGTFFKPIEYQELLLNDDNFSTSVESYTLKFTDADYGADPLQGCARPLYLVIGEIINCSVDLAKELERLDLLEAQSVEEFSTREDLNYIFMNFNCISLKQQRYELHNKTESEFTRLDEKIIQSKPNDIALSYLENDSELELHLTLFETYQLTAQIYLRMLVLHRPPCSSDMQRLLHNLTNCVDILIGSKVQASLCFPLLVAGLQCVSKLDRMIMSKRFEHMITHFPVMNFELVKKILDELWRRNKTGEKCIDWSTITDDLGWDLCVS